MLIERVTRKLIKLCNRHKNKAERYEKLAAKYTDLAKQHRKISDGYADASSTILLNEAIEPDALIVSATVATKDALRVMGEDLARLQYKVRSRYNPEDFRL